VYKGYVVGKTIAPLHFPRECHVLLQKDVTDHCPVEVLLDRFIFRNHYHALWNASWTIDHLLYSTLTYYHEDATTESDLTQIKGRRCRRFDMWLPKLRRIWGYEIQKLTRLHYYYSSCSLSLLRGKELLIKRCHLTRTVDSYHKDLNLVILILISKLNYKIKTYFTSCFQDFCIILYKFSSEMWHCVVS
jgi:hypothetical protein